MTPVPVLDTQFLRTALGDSLIDAIGPDATFARAVIDSRRTQAGDLFVALPGEHVDGHDFARAAIDGGATGALLTHDVAGIESATRMLVPDALAGLQRLAVAWRDALVGTEVVGVTGNVGKSTTKMIVAAVLASQYRVQVNEANYNNEIGVPLCLLELHPETERAVIEMGMYTTGEIALLCTWTHPQIGIVLNVGPVHMERAGSLEAIARAKRELPESLTSEGHAILNIDDPLVRAMAEHTSGRVWFFGTSTDAHVRGSDVTSHGAAGFECTIAFEEHSARVHVPLAGGHLLSNVLAAVAAGLADGVPFEACIAAIAALDVPQRISVRTLPGDVTLLDDTYNASPAATVAALDLLAETPGRHLALLGDMLELGEVSEAEHDRVGQHAATACDALFTVGELAVRISDAAREAGLSASTHCDSKDAAVALLRATLRPGDVLLVKASRALALETVVRALESGTGATS
ncbi:MAG: UDP-N-acetylmuramoyl-tripeptide--D-alanyl-D-alanine ligase [Chloroflexi bacterium]|nr:MAG: UDP-N-acetylmuramoyl-tripeptide--D-alanyl-D-alanine ligase [Chloroflexota bacterium]